MPNPIDTMVLYQNALNNRVTQSASANKQQDGLKKACNDFEALFVKYMMQQMRETIPEDGLLGRSQAEKIYTSLLDDEVAKSVSNGRGLGLARAMYEQMAALHGDGAKK